MNAYLVSVRRRAPTNWISPQIFGNPNSALRQLDGCSYQPCAPRSVHVGLCFQCSQLSTIAQSSICAFHDYACFREFVELAPFCSPFSCLVCGSLVLVFHLVLYCWEPASYARKSFGSLANLRVPGYGVPCKNTQVVNTDTTEACWSYRVLPLAVSQTTLRSGPLRHYAGYLWTRETRLLYGHWTLSPWHTGSMFNSMTPWDMYERMHLGLAFPYDCIGTEFSGLQAC